MPPGRAAIVRRRIIIRAFLFIRAFGFPPLLDITDIIMSQLFNLTASQGLYNCRTKLYYNSDGSYRIAEEMVCSSPIFNPDGLELIGERSARSFGNKTSEADKVSRSKSRANAKIKDLIMCNDFTHFVTLTLSADKVNREDYSSIIRKLNSYLANRVRRNGLYYVGVPELHKRGGFHFHFLVNDVLPLVDSGTVIRPSGGKPVKVKTALYQRYKLEDCKTVYNIADWSLGFTTAIRLYGDRLAVANYIGKYITKGDKVGGRWYYSGGALRRPKYIYCNIDYDKFDCDYSFECPSGEFLVKLY